VPSSVLETALVTKVVRKSYSIDGQDSGDYPMPGGLDITFYGEYVSGNPGCQSLLSPHTVDAASFAYVSMSNKATEFTEVTESYPTVPEAQRVMAQNFVEAKECHTFKMHDTNTGETVTYKHTVTATKHGDVDLFLHHFTGSTKKWVYEFHMFEGRLGGEMMHMLWSSFATRTDPSSAAFTQFQKVVNACRKDHPRQGNGASSGVSPVRAVPTGVTGLPRHVAANQNVSPRRVAR
jgi:hypothetical protein